VVAVVLGLQILQVAVVALVDLEHLRAHLVEAVLLKVH
jgi:hypothetical protein